jgi:hypothetical protein
MKESTQKTIFVVILGVALVLRLRGLHWALPDAEHYCSFHPDEWGIVNTCQTLDVFHGKMNPHFFAYGSLYIYMVYFISLLAQGLGWLDLQLSTNAFDISSKIHLLGRGLTVFMGCLTVLFTYLIARRVHNVRTALFAAMLLSLMPLHIMHSHFVTVDITTACLSTLSLWLIIEFASSKSFRTAILAAFAVGLATGTKYSVGPALAVTLLAVSWHSGLFSGMRILISRAFFLILAMMGGFFAATPYSLLSPREFWRGGILFNLYSAMKGIGLLFIGTGNGHWYHFSVNLPAALGTPLLLLCLIGIFISLKGYLIRNNGNKSTPHDWILLLFLAVFFLLLGFARLRFARYLMPLLPVLAIYGGKAAEMIWVKPAHPVYRRWRAMLGTTLVLFVTLYTLGYAITTSSLFVQNDSRNEATAWLKERIGPEITIAYIGPPSYALPPPPYCPFNGQPTQRAFLEWNQANSLYSLRVIEAKIAELQENKPDFLVISEIQYTEINRLKSLDTSSLPPAVQKRILESIKFSDFVEQHADLSASFKSKLMLFGIPFGPKQIPHDMLYVNPEIRIYSFKKNDSSME